MTDGAEQERASSGQKAGAEGMPGTSAAAAPAPTPARLTPHPQSKRPPPAFFGSWLLAIRPKTLPAAIAPVAVGTACAYAVDGFRAGPALAALIGALLLQIASNLANDVFDFEKGVDTGDRLGPTRVVQSGLLSARQVRFGLGLVIALALAIGVYLTWVAGAVVVVIGLSSIGAAIAYTGGPYPLGYHGLGDIAVMLFFGFVAVCGTAYVQALYVPTLAWWSAIPVGALATAILVVNNLRDLETDARAGKRTLAVRLGRARAVLEYRLLLAAAYALPVVLVAVDVLHVWALLPLLTLPLALRLGRRVARERGEPLNQALAATARLLFLHGVLFAAGIALGAR
ncbi:MAG TPA: 1,4-dihydroxy-2-naphthoate polyprenyltransferase [Longimicrobiales bacterium]|nr:1,4-dihydroxy-2-naphthoate polyprenyltransferase [Longimicrobiales bacterium]